MFSLAKHTSLIANACGAGYVFLFQSASNGRVAQLVRALLSHSRGPGFESLHAHSVLSTKTKQAANLTIDGLFRFC